MQSFMVKYLEKSPPTKSTSQPLAPPLQVWIHNFHLMKRMMLVMTSMKMMLGTCLGTCLVAPWCWWWRCAGRPAAPGLTAPRPRVRSATAACSPRPSCAPASTQVGRAWDNPTTNTFLQAEFLRGDMCKWRVSRGRHCCFPSPRPRLPVALKLYRVILWPEKIAIWYVTKLWTVSETQLHGHRGHRI